MRQYRAMIRYCFPHIDLDSIKDEAEFAELANEADWVVKNIIHPYHKKDAKSGNHAHIM